MKRRGKKNRTKDRESLEQAYLAFKPTLLRYLAARLGSRDDAQDIAQEAYLRLLRVENVELIDNLEGYLFRIVTNLANEWHYKRGRSLEDMDIDTLIEIGGDGDERFGETQLELRAAVQKLHRILESLPPLYRVTILMRKRDGYTHKEIAEEVGKSPHTVHLYLKRGLARCRELWDEM